MRPEIIKKFRSEIRRQKDIMPDTTIILNNDPLRAANTKMAVLLLKKIFSDRITIKYSSKGIICGSKEEFVADHIREYTAGRKKKPMILTTIPAVMITQTTKEEAYVPESAEMHFIKRLSADHPQVWESR